MIHRAYDLEDGRQIAIFQNKNGHLVIKCTRDLEEGEKRPELPKMPKKKPLPPAGIYIDNGKVVSHLVIVQEAALPISVGLIQVLGEIEKGTK